MRVAEVFGYDVDDQSAQAWADRNVKLCPFRQSACTKSSVIDPLGICSLSDGTHAASLCPVRFLEGRRIFADAGRLAFGTGTRIAVFPEVRILTVKGQQDERDRKIGKVDFLIGKVTDGTVVDFAAVEVQAAYFSGGNLRSVLRSYLAQHHLHDINADRRPDFRSSAQKRLVPQLALKVPVFRRWGKKFFVVVDAKFFGALPKFAEVSPSNSEVTWLVYPFSKTNHGYELGDPRIAFSHWDDVQTALREGQPPEPDEIIAELQLKLSRQRRRGDPTIII